MVDCFRWPVGPFGMVQGAVERLGPVGVSGPWVTGGSLAGAGCAGLRNRRFTLPRPGCAVCAMVRSTASGNSFVRITRPRAARSAATYEIAAKPSTMASRNRPICLANGMIAIMPPITQTSWKRVSNLANARPRDCIGTVALQQAVEPQPPGRGADPDRERGEHEADRARHERAEQREDGGEHETTTRGSPLRAPSGGAWARRARRRSCRRTPPTPAAPSANEIALERERGEEDQEADARPQHGERARTEQDARRVHLLPLELLLLLVGGLAQSPSCGIWMREDRRDHEHDRAVAQRPVGAEELVHHERRGQCRRRRPTALMSARRELAVTSSASSVTRAGTSALLAIALPFWRTSTPKRERIHEQALGRRFGDVHGQARRTAAPDPRPTRSGRGAGPPSCGRARDRAPGRRSRTASS